MTAYLYSLNKKYHLNYVTKGMMYQNKLPAK